jgi:hypothetical protein
VTTDVKAGWRPLLGVLIGSGFRTAPLTAAALALMSIAAAATSVCYSIGFRLVIDGAVAHDGGRIAGGRCS